jgi:hypothetical protein
MRAAFVIWLNNVDKLCRNQLLFLQRFKAAIEHAVEFHAGSPDDKGSDECVSDGTLGD